MFEVFERTSLQLSATTTRQVRSDLLTTRFGASSTTTSAFVSNNTTNTEFVSSNDNAATNTPFGAKTNQNLSEICPL